MSILKYLIIAALVLAIPVSMVACDGSTPESSDNTETLSMMERETMMTETKNEEKEEFTTDHTVTADFSDKVGSPLVKKFGVFDSGLVSVSRTRNHLPLIKAINAESFRVELGMGRGDMLFHDLVKEKYGELTYNWTNIDKVAKDLNSYGVLPYWAYGYCPYPLQNKNDSREQPNNLREWQKICAEIAAHFKNEGIRIGYHEVWNEPDCFDVFYLGSWADYLALYKYGARGIREGDPDAVVGGPSTAFVMNPGTNYKDFITFVEKNDLPLDYFSMHRYGTDYKDKIKLVRSQLANADDRFDTTAIHINEINVETDWKYGGPCDRFKLASSVMTVISDLMEEHDVTVISWAQFLESGVDALGIVDEAGKKKATYNAFEIFARMPVDRYNITISNDAIRGMASADTHRSSVVLWNTTTKDQEISIGAKDLPFRNGTIRIYRVDKDHSEVGDDLALCEEIELSDSSIFEWNGTLPKYGIIYFEVNDNTGESDLAPVSLGNASIVRTEHYFPDRTKNSAPGYAYFDETTWTAWLGSGSESSYWSTVGVLAKDLPEEITAEFTLEDGIASTDNNSLLGLRLDYETVDGYTYSVLYHNGIYSDGRTDNLPWGTKKNADKAILTELDSFEFSPSENAPDGWTGRVLISFHLQNCGTDKNIKITLR